MLLGRHCPLPKTCFHYKENAGDLDLLSLDVCGKCNGQNNEQRFEINLYM